MCAAAHRPYFPQATRACTNRHTLGAHDLHAPMTKTGTLLYCRPITGHFSTYGGKDKFSNHNYTCGLSTKASRYKPKPGTTQDSHTTKSLVTGEGKLPAAYH
ncbi:hypothetical protein BaRGS_00003181 [Batillaria attramentaria]|uniref:Uncharacterized protein n=1 Tax=Batillaria attramentaria TaxID=370345 RepID=A0ABD0M158_9CAEN